MYYILKSYSILLVKYSSLNSPSGAAWCEYKAKKGRNLKSVQTYFSARPGFRFIRIFEYNQTTKTRGIQVGYIDRKTIKYTPVCQ